MTWWTDERVEELRLLHNRGLTRAQIGLAMGITRNKAAGKLDRLGLMRLSREEIEERHEARIRNKIPRPRENYECGGWDARTFLPYSDWKIWNRQRRMKENENS